MWWGGVVVEEGMAWPGGRERKKQRVGVGEEKGGAAQGKRNGTAQGGFRGFDFGLWTSRKTNILHGYQRFDQATGFHFLLCFPHFL
jgi:hypothetical protein